MHPRWYIYTRLYGTRGFKTYIINDNGLERSHGVTLFLDKRCSTKVYKNYRVGKYVQGSKKTLEFIDWLGVNVPEATSLRILNSENPLYESIRICTNSLQQILDAVIPYNLPLGLNIESLTNRKEEIDGSILLYKLLRSTMDNFLAKKELSQLNKK